MSVGPIENSRSTGCTEDYDGEELPGPHKYVKPKTPAGEYITSTHIQEEQTVGLTKLRGLISSYSVSHFQMILSSVV